MIHEILVRHFTPELKDLSDKLTQLIRDETNFMVSQIDHTNLSMSDFFLSDFENVISIDRHLAKKFNVPCARTSRIFNEQGEITGRILELPENFRPNQIIIDTDVCSGNSLQAAYRLLQTNKSRIALKVEAYQDLIDVEDLVFDNSVLKGDKTCSYLLNPEFFTKRTSLPIELYADVFLLVTDFRKL